MEANPEVHNLKSETGTVRSKPFPSAGGDVRESELSTEFVEFQPSDFEDSDELLVGEVDSERESIELLESEFTDKRASSLRTFQEPEIAENSEQENSGNKSSLFARAIETWNSISFREKAMAVGFVGLGAMSLALGHYPLAALDFGVAILYATGKLSSLYRS